MHHEYTSGLLFFKENISKLENENDEHMPIGFEVAFPSLLEIARSLDIEVPYDSPVLQKIYDKRNLKLTRYVAIIIMFVTFLDFIRYNKSSSKKVIFIFYSLFIGPFYLYIYVM